MAVSSAQIEWQRQTRPEEGLAFIWQRVPTALRYIVVAGLPGTPAPPIDEVLRGATPHFTSVEIPREFSGAVDVGSPVGDERQYSLFAVLNDGRVISVNGVQYFKGFDAPQDRDYYAVEPQALIGLPDPTGAPAADETSVATVEPLAQAPESAPVQSLHPDTPGLDAAATTVTSQSGPYALEPMNVPATAATVEVSGPYVLEPMPALPSDLPIADTVASAVASTATDVTTAATALPPDSLPSIDAATETPTPPASVDVRPDGGSPPVPSTTLNGDPAGPAGGTLPQPTSLTAPTMPAPPRGDSNVADDKQQVKTANGPLAAHGPRPIHEGPTRGPLADAIPGSTEQVGSPVVEDQGPTAAAVREVPSSSTGNGVTVSGDVRSPTSRPDPALIAMLDEAELWLRPQWADYEQAARLLEEARAIAPDNARLGELQDRLHAIKEDAAPNRAHLLHEARQRLEARDYWQAVDIYEQILAQQPDNQEAQQSVARARILGRFAGQMTAAGVDPEQLQRLGDDYATLAPDLASQAYAAAFKLRPAIVTLRGWLLSLASSGQMADIVAVAQQGVLQLRQAGRVVTDPAQDSALAVLQERSDTGETAGVNEAITQLIQALVESASSEPDRSADTAQPAQGAPTAEREV
jgi:hypothetical protein